ncbi:ervatamin-B-like [Asparagus officinalis]|uniref:ervatamin-B-like n=1 Tax=Asparagus officinalis TaxID=4686 RepID=UPI00098E1F1C|nr:ervatamin-B-like [Asparagus officinalis]
MAARNQAVWLALLMLALWVCAAATSRTTATADDMSVRHEQWMAEHERQYKNAAEKKYRLKIFKSNVERIESVNRDGERKYELSVNRFADLTDEEFKTYYKGFKPKPIKATATNNETLMNMSDVPPSVDWRAKGAVTGVKDQGQCGCCWAFSTVGATEGLIQIKKGNLTSLSEQQLVDCVTGGVTRGCEGGLMDEAFEYIIQNKGIASEETYPYTATEGTCNTDATSAATITGYEKVPANSEEALMAAVATQPVSVAIDGGGPDFKFYSRGVFTGPCGTDLDHAVTLVGYGTEESADGTKYWLVKNSWGETWGEGGYMRMARDVGAPEGLCGIAKDASYPTLN